LFTTLPESGFDWDTRKSGEYRQIVGRNSQVGIVFALVMSSDMKTLSPYFPAVSLISVVRGRIERERFRKKLFIILAGPLTLGVGLVIHASSFQSRMMEEEAPRTIPKGATEVAPATSTTLASPPAPVTAGSMTISLPPAAPTSLKQPQLTPATPPAEVLYVIKSGDTLTSIARTHGTTFKMIKALNNLSSERLVVGKTLKLPNQGGASGQK
jgi:LysM repeat protein